MPAKKKITRKKPSKTTPRKSTAKKKPAMKKAAAQKQSSKKKPAPKKAIARKKTAASRKTAINRTATAPTRQVREKSFPVGRPSSRRGLGSDVGGQSGDLQGLSRRRGPDSETVEELLEEGNAFEADVVSGVEAADNTDEQPVRTHEISEDDIPGEYLDKDS